MNKNNPYHPFRYDKHLGEMIADVVEKYEDSSEEDRERMGGLLLSAFFEEEIETVLSLERTNESLQGLSVDQWCEYKSRVLFHFSGFNRAGSNVFHVQEELLEMFQKTDVGDVLLSDIITPFPAFYLYFGKKDAVKIADGRYVDGAYVDYDTSRGEYSLHICLTERSQELNFFNIDLDEFSFLMKEDHLDYFISGGEGECVKDVNWYKVGWPTPNKKRTSLVISGGRPAFLMVDLLGFEPRRFHL